MDLDLENYMTLKKKLQVRTAPFISANNSHISLTTGTWESCRSSLCSSTPLPSPSIICFVYASVLSYQLAKVKLPQCAQWATRKKLIHVPLEEQSPTHTRISWHTPMHGGRRSNHWEKEETSHWSYHMHERGESGFPSSLITSYIHLPPHILQPLILHASKNILEKYILSIKLNQG